MRGRWVTLLVVPVLFVGCSDEEGVSSANTLTAPPPSQPAAATPSDQVVIACLGPDHTSDEDLRDLWDRISVPSETGVGTDHLPGIAAVTTRGNGIAVVFDAGTTTADRERVLDSLDVAPVEAVLSGASVQVCR